MKFKTLQKKLKLLSCGTDPKTIKGNDSEWLTAILYLLPDDELCPMATMAGCKDACLNTAGLGGVYSSIQVARKRKAQLFKLDSVAFMAVLAEDIDLLLRYCEEHGLKLAIRLNGTSDIAYENIRAGDYSNIFERYPVVTFYDYSKLPARNISGIKNYSITWSYSEHSAQYSSLFSKARKQGHNVAVVFGGKLPKYFLGLPVIDADKNDRRFLDPESVIVGLKAKGPAKKDKSGFVVWDTDVIARVAA